MIVSDSDSTCQVITDPDSTCQIILGQDPEVKGKKFRIRADPVSQQGQKKTLCIKKMQKRESLSFCGPRKRQAGPNKTYTVIGYFTQLSILSSHQKQIRFRIMKFSYSSSCHSLSSTPSIPSSSSSIFSDISIISPTA